MEILSRAARYCLDFFFPKTASVVVLESIPSGELVDTLPQAMPTKTDDVVAIFDYSHPVVRDMVWELKYGGNKQVAVKLGEIVYDVLTAELEERALSSAAWRDERPILIPMPISDKRRFERGWNQAEILAEALLTHDKERRIKYLPRHLAKLRHTDSQTSTASKEERQKNIKESMKVLHNPAVEGRCVVVLDDVFTTGATFGEARRALKAAGARHVFCLAVAH